MIDDEPLNPKPDDPLERAAAAARRLSVSHEPSDQALARTLKAVEAWSAGAPILFRFRRTSMLTVLKVGCAATMIAGTALYFGVVRHAAANTEFVEAVQKLERAETLSFLLTITMAGQKEPMVMRQYYKTPGLLRSELQGPSRSTTVLDYSVQKSLTIDPAQKSALLIDMPKGPEPVKKKDFAGAMIDDIRDIASKGGEPAGQRLIGKQTANGFRLKAKEGNYVVWVNPEKKIPLLIELEGTMGNIAFHGSMSDFEFDPKLDDAMFSLEVPPGYTTQKTDGAIKTSPEDLVARLLRRYSARNGGKFPDRLDDQESLTKGLGTKEKNGSLPDQIQDVSAILLFIFYTENNKDRWGYQGSGAKLGDASQIVFWYKPEGKQLYRVVYGDLHIGDVTADKLPQPIKK